VLSVSSIACSPFSGKLGTYDDPRAGKRRCILHP
jgi:hypothetical protein